MKAMGVDPGKTSGIAVIEIENRKFKPIYFMECKDMTLLEIRELISQMDFIVCEDFEIDPKYARTGKLDGDKLPATQVIGALRVHSTMADVPLYFQRRLIKPMGYGFSGQKYVKGKKGMHNQDALAHVVYYCVSKRLCDPHVNKNL